MSVKPNKNLKKKIKIPVILPSKHLKNVKLKHGKNLELLELTDEEFTKLANKLRKSKPK